MNPKEIHSGFNLGFDQGIAEKLGVDAALIFNHIVYWLKINARKPDVELIDGKIWMYETHKQMSEFFGFLSEDQISKGVIKLREAKLIETKPLGKNPFDRTLSYTVFDQDMVNKRRTEEDKIKNTIPRQRGIDTPKSAESDSAPARNGHIYTIEEKEKTATEKQKRDAADLSQRNPFRSTILADVDIPEHDKAETLNRFPEDVIKNAVAWATHPETKINKSLAAAIKWACQHKPEVPKNAKDEAKANKAYAKKYEGTENEHVRVDILNAEIEIVYKGCQKDPIVISYQEKGFMEQLHAALRKVNIKL